MTVADLALADASADCLAHEQALLTARAEGATYRELFLLTLAAWQADQQRLRGATQRLKQLAGLETWHLDQD